MSERELRRLSVREFRDLGYLQEVNRRLLHPLGLALEATQADEPVARVTLRADDVAALRELAAAARGGPLDEEAADALLERLDRAERYEPGDGWISGVWDYRADPEGILFLDDAAGAAERAAKALLVQEEWNVRRPERERLLGYMVQPAEPRPSP